MSTFTSPGKESVSSTSSRRQRTRSLSRSSNLVPSNNLERRFPLADSDFETQESPRPAILSYVDGIHFDLFKDNINLNSIGTQSQFAYPISRADFNGTGSLPGRCFPIRSLHPLI